MRAFFDVYFYVFDCSSVQMFVSFQFQSTSYFSLNTNKNQHIFLNFVFSWKSFQYIRQFINTICVIFVKHNFLSSSGTPLIHNTRVQLTLDISSMCIYCIIWSSKANANINISSTFSHAAYKTEDNNKNCFAIGNFQENYLTINNFRRYYDSFVNKICENSYFFCNEYRKHFQVLAF